MAIFFSLNTQAENTHIMGKAVKQVKIEPLYVKIREPFTALAIASLKIKNETDRDLKIKKIYSPQARHIGVYHSSINEFGAEQIKRAKNIYIPANKTTKFAEKEYKIMLTGLKRKYEVGEEIDLTIEFEGLGKYQTYLPVHANYK